MILGIGSDLVDIRRIAAVLERHGARFEKRCFTQSERQKALSRKETGLDVQTYAKHFAAKEACVKALGTGVSGPVYLKDIGVIRDQWGKPALALTGGALEQLNHMTPRGMQPRLHLSLSDEPPHAQAFVIIEAISQQEACS